MSVDSVDYECCSSRTEEHVTPLVAVHSLALEALLVKAAAATECGRGAAGEYTIAVLVVHVSVAE